MSVARCTACGAYTRLTRKLAESLGGRGICVACHGVTEVTMLSPKLEKSLSHQKPSDAACAKIEQLREAAKAFGEVLELQTKPSREQSLAITNLEQSLMWAIKGVVLE